MHLTSRRQEGMVAVILYLPQPLSDFGSIAFAHWSEMYPGGHEDCSQHPPAELTAMPDWRTLVHMQEGEGGCQIVADILIAARTLQQSSLLCLTVAT